MADPNRCLPYNAPGRFYVDDCCTNCQLCSRFAPNHFAFNESQLKSYIIEQPRTVPEIALVKEVAQYCPSQAIGDRTEYYSNSRAQSSDNRQENSAAA